MVISDEMRARIRERMRHYPAPRGTLLPALHLVQEQLGYIPSDAARELAELFELQPAEVMEVVSFYNLFFDAPQPRHHASVCTNLPCSLRGARGLLRRLEAHLGVAAGGATPDGRIALVHEECLGACASAPMMRVDGVYHEDLDFERAVRILDALE